MKHNCYFLIFLLLFPFASVKATERPEVTPGLQQVLSEKGEDEFIALNIRLSDQYDNNLLYGKSRAIEDPQQRRRFVVEELKEYSSRQQAGLLSLLRQWEQEGKVKEIQPYWIANFIHCKIKPDRLETLKTRTDIARLDYDKVRPVLLSGGKMEGPAAPADKLRSPELAWNVTLILADQAWDLGYTGEGVVVAVLDTGVNYNHQDLQGNMWEHENYPNHGYNFVDNNHNTMDYQGHGTHCAGTVAGNGAAGIGTGIAPDAKIMALQVLNDQGGGTESGVWAGIQFAVDYGADIMSLSLGWRHAWGPDYYMWRTTMNNALSAGLIATAAAGNGGNMQPGPPRQVRTPGNIPPPWLHPDQTLTGGTSAVVSVGSTTQDDEISGFSSQGPSTWADVAPFNDYPYDPEMGLIRPDVTAPGSDVLSLTHNSNTGYTVKSGTSMATPATAGVLALMLSKNPHLSPEELSQLLEESVLPMTESKSNVFGSGRVDALAAVLHTPFHGVVYAGHTIDDSEGNNDGKINPGELIKLDVTFENPTEETFEDIQAVLTTTSPYITLLDSTASLGDFQPSEVLEFQELFSFSVSDTIPGNHPIGFSVKTYADATPDEHWRVHFSEMAFAPLIEFAGLIVDDSEHGNDNGMLDPGEQATLLFRIENNGQLPTEEINLFLEAHQPFVYLESPSMTIETIDSTDYVYAGFEVLIAEALNPGTLADFTLELESGAYVMSSEFSEKIGLVVEDWESGDFETFDWTFAGHADWYLVTDEVYEGTYAARSGDIDHSQQTELIIEYRVLEDDSISFYRKVSSENNYDWLEFYIDNQRVGRWSGERDWARVAYPVEAGERTFRWVYKKDYVISEGQDCGWIDKITFPPKGATMAFAGFDTEACAFTPHELQAYATLYNQLQWSSSGDGTFDDPGELHTFYTPGPEDNTQGSVTLTLEVQYPNEDPVQDQMQLTILPTPEVDLGGDKTVCYGETLLLDAGEGDYTYLWFDGSEDQTFLVDPDDFEEEEVEIWVIVSHENGCEGIDTVKVEFLDCTGIYETDLAEKLEIFPNPARESVSITFYTTHGGESQVRLINANGQRVKSLNTISHDGKNHLEMDVSDLYPGIYFLRIDNRHFSATRKLIIH